MHYNNKMDIKNKDCFIESKEIRVNIIANMLDFAIYLKHNGYSFMGIRVDIEYFNKVKEILDRKHE